MNAEFPYRIEVGIECNKGQHVLWWLCDNIGPEHEVWDGELLHTDVTVNVRYWRINFANEEDMAFFALRWM